MSTATRVNVVLAVLLGLIIAAHWVLPSAPTQRNFHFFPDMVDSLAHEAQAPAPRLASGMAVDLRPPEGSVARGYLPLTYEATPEDAARAGAELQSPHPADDAGAVERGGFVYATFCATCHGAGGEGDGPMTQRGVPPPPSLLLPHAVELADGQMYHLITLGQGNMAGYAAQVERMDRWNVISYIRTLQTSVGAQPAAVPEPAAEVPEEAGVAPSEAPPEETAAPAPEAPEETTSVEEEATP